MTPPLWAVVAGLAYCAPGSDGGTFERFGSSRLWDVVAWLAVCDALGRNAGCAPEAGRNRCESLDK